MKKINLSLVAVAIIVIAAASFSIIAEAGQVTGFNTYKSCADDSECGENGYCVGGECKETKRW